MLALAGAGLCTVASGTLLGGLLEKSDRYALRYTDVSVEGAPPFVALGTAVGALRGLIVDYLWIKVNLMKEKGLFYEVMADAELITKLQPRFAAVWAFHGHNMAYNISVATNTQIERWEWVNAGIRLVRNEGLRYNPQDLTLYRELSFWFGHKIEGVADDAHLYYKTQFCREWHNLLGAPPDDPTERLAWIKRVADAPETLEEAEVRTPGVAALVADLRAIPPPLPEQSAVEPDANLLRMHTIWSEVKSNSLAARIRGLLEKGLEQAAFTELDRLAGDPARAAAWETLLAFARKKVLRDDYNMDARLMYEYTRDLGPIDWRSGFAHQLYWSRTGSLVAQHRVANKEDIYKIVNNDRMHIQSLQGLARHGRIVFDYYSEELPMRLSEPAFIPTIHEQFEALYVKHYKTRGAGGEGFIGFYQNFMSSVLREWFRSGERAKAEELRQKLNDLFGSSGNYKWAQPLEQIVREETQEEYEFQPHIAPSEVGGALRHAFVNGLGQGRPELLEEARRFGRQVIEYFQGNEYNNFVNKFGRGRMKELVWQLEDMEKVVFAQVMVDRSLQLPYRFGIWARADEAEPDLRRFAYDRIKPALERELAASHYARQWTLDAVLPEPPGLEEYKLREAQQLAQRQKDMEEARQRDEVMRGGAS
jgi:hypothetical protein